MKENKEIKNVQLVLADELTNEMIFDGYLIGVYNPDDITVTIVKNEMNSVSGDVSLSLWHELVNYYSAMGMVQEKEEKEKEEKEEIYKSINSFKDLEDFITPLFNEIKPNEAQVHRLKSKGDVIFTDVLSKLEKIVDDIQSKDEENKEEEGAYKEQVKRFRNLKSKGNAIFNDVLSKLEKTVDDMQSKEDEEDEEDGENEKTFNNINKTELILQRAKLRKIIKDAEELEVSTKGFSKKVQSKIQYLDILLES